MEEVARHGDQLGVRSVGVLADDPHPPVPDDRRVDHDTFVGACDHARSVCAENPWLRDGRKAFPDPDVEVVERCRAQLDECLALGRNRIGSVLVAQHFRPAVLVDPDRLHAGMILA
jgi:hypothetical protein